MMHVKPLFVSDEQLLRAQVESWYPSVVNYLATGEMPREWTKDDRACFLALVRFF